MFDWNLFFLLLLVCLPGVLIAARGSMATLERLIASQSVEQKIPPKNVLIAITALQSLFLTAIAAALGTALAGKVGLAAPFFQALAVGDPFWPSFRSQFPWALGMGSLGALIFIGSYYAYFRPRLDSETVRVTEALRAAIGLSGRILYGAVVEEVLVRWGLMSLFVWLLSFFFEPLSSLAYWIAIILSGLLFALGHIPGSLAAGAKKTPMFYAATLFLNGWASLIFGWLFWQHGLLAAILAHALLHLLWYPLEERAREA